MLESRAIGYTSQDPLGVLLPRLMAVLLRLRSTLEACLEVLGATKILH